MAERELTSEWLREWSAEDLSRLTALADRFERKNLRVSVVRPDDHLVLEFEFVNLVLDPDDPGRLVRGSSSGAAWLVVHFPAQHVHEEAFYEADGEVADDDPHPKPSATEIPDDPPVQARLAGRSRLVFRVPADVDAIPFELEALLERCRTWQLAVAPVALPAPEPKSQLVYGLVSRFDPYQVALASETLAAQIEARVRSAVEELGDPRGADDMVRRILGDASLRDAAASTVERAVGGALSVFASAQESLLVRGKYFVMAPPRQPRLNETAIELPWRLYLSPSRLAAWAHALSPVTHGGRTELWHTRLGVRSDDGAVDERATQQRTLRAIWSDDYDLPTADTHVDMPFRGTLTARDREMLVKATAGFDMWGYTPLPTRTRRLMLSGLGGWLDTEGSWTMPPSSGVELEAWRHRSTMARDQYVRVVYKGYLFPLGHGASLVKVSERKFVAHEGEQVAYLKQRFFIVVRERTKTYPGPAQPHGGREFPFSEATITTLTTPDLEPPGSGAGNVAALAPVPYSNQAAFWPRVPGEDFLFHVRLKGITGKTHDVTMPLMFLSVEGDEPNTPNGRPPLAYSRDHVALAIADMADGPVSRRNRPLHGQPIDYAPSSKEGDTCLPTADITFGGTLPTSALALGTPVFHPRLVSTRGQQPAMSRMLGSGATLDLQFPAVYLQNGLAGANTGLVFLERTTGAAAQGLQFGQGNQGDKAGGLATPDLSIAGLSTTLGPVGGSSVSDVAGGTFDPADFFDGAKILGALDLFEILPLPKAFDPSNPATVPGLTSQREGDTIVTRFHWKTADLRSDPAGLFLPDQGGTSELSIDTTIVSPIPGLAPPGDPQLSTEAKLNDFKVNLFGFIILWFRQLTFRTGSGKKADVDLDFDDTDGITFGGPLEFVNTLREFIPSNGFSDPPAITIDPEGLKASYSLGLPTINVGVFSLQNISLGAGFVLPFNGDPAAVRFNFCERHSPFVLTVSMFGGGGFFAIGIDAGGMQRLEAALEFRGELSLDVGVASGGVYLKAGIYFEWTQDLAVLTGFVEVGGHLSVLGLISVSLTFNMSLTYTDAGKVWGQATLVVKVEVLFFSASVSVTVEKQFKGSDNDPSFQQLLPEPELWDEYCEAFAPEGALS